VITVFDPHGPSPPHSQRPRWLLIARAAPSAPGTLMSDSDAFCHALAAHQQPEMGPHHPILVCLDSRFYRRIDPRPQPPTPAASNTPKPGVAPDAAAAVAAGPPPAGGRPAVVSVVGKAYGRMGLVRAARALCATGATPADVTGDALAREMLRPLHAPAPAAAPAVPADGGPATRGGHGACTGVCTEDEEWAAAAAAGEPELAINVGPPGVCGDFLPWQVPGPLSRALPRPDGRCGAVWRADAWRAKNSHRPAPALSERPTSAHGGGGAGAADGGAGGGVRGAGRDRWRAGPPPGPLRGHPAALRHVI
jgi:hypothetical protein